MNDLLAAIMAGVASRFGLCDTCVHQRLVRSGRGSEFSLCLRHKADARFAKYPRAPVLRCPGFEPRSSALGTPPPR